MRISQVIEQLSRMRDAHGDLQVTILDDESGDYEPIECGALFVRAAEKPCEIMLMTARQAE